MNLAEAISLYAGGTSEGASKGWDKRGRGRKAKQVESKVVGSGWLFKGKFYPLPAGEGIDMAVHFEVLEKLHPGAPVYARDVIKHMQKLKEWLHSAYERGFVRIAIRRDTAELEGWNNSSFRDVLAMLPREVKKVNIEYWSPRHGDDSLSKEEAIDLYAEIAKKKEEK